MRRRIAALVVLLAVVALVGWGASALVGVLGATAGSAVEAQETSEPKETRPVDPTSCRSGDLDVELTATGDRAPVSINATLTNSGEVPCLVDAGRAALVVTITSGSDLVWSSDDCDAAPAERQLLLDAGDSAETELTWDATRSTPCEGEKPVVGAGTYQAKASLAGRELETVTFALS